MTKRFFKPRRIRTDQLRIPRGEKEFILKPSPFALGQITSGGYQAQDFDAVTDYATRGANLTGLADGKQGLFSGWCRLDGGDAAGLIMLANATAIGGGTSRFAIQRFSDNKFYATGLNAAGATILNINTVATFLTNSAWRHVLMSWDLANAASRHIYINDVSDLNVITFTNDTIDYAQADWADGALPSGANKFNGCRAETFFHDVYMDLSVIANRRKFILANGKPANLGPNGELPLGFSPRIYSPDGNPALNKGTGGNFTITGVLDLCSNAPGL